MGKRVIVIGGGASGMTAAIFAARVGADVTLLEHTDRLGKKLLSTGNGKCNLSNKKMDATCYRSGEADFPMAVLSQFGVKQTREFFEALGIVIKERDGYFYPHSGQASSVLELLWLELKSQRVQVITDCSVEKLLSQKEEDGAYQVFTSKGRFWADSVILATGSCAAPATGSDGSGYVLAKTMGLHIVKPLPALVQLRCREGFYKQITGIRMDGAVSIWAGGQKLAADRGELQLTDYGISGIPVFQVSRFAAVALDKGKKVEALIDFYPEWSTEETTAFLLERCRSSGHKRAEDFFTGWFNKKLSALFLKLSGIEGTRLVKRITPEEIKQLTFLIKEFRTQITGTNPFANAQICCGGVDVKEIDSKTMEVRKKKGLYLIGELLDVDGICGGYNLQWAWSTGAIAGTHAGL